MAFSTASSARSITGVTRGQLKSLRARVIVYAENEADKPVPEQKDTVFYGGNSYTGAEVSYISAPGTWVIYTLCSVQLSPVHFRRVIIRDTE